MASTRANRWAARLDKIFRWTLPEVNLSTSGAINSAIVFTAFAPMASRQSTIMCKISIGPERDSTIRVSILLQPPPSLIIVEGRLLQRLINSSLA